MRICDAAVEVLRETGNAAVMHGDLPLLVQIAKRHGHYDGHPLWVEKRVLSALTSTPGSLVPGKTRNGRGRLVRIFRLPEERR